MPWFKVDDGFYTSSKFLDIPRDYQAQAAGLWMLAGVYSAHKMTDGFVSNGQLQLWEFDQQSRAWLVAVGLWDEVDNGIQFHDWCDYQPTREALEAKAVARSEKNKQNVAKRWDKDKTDTTGIRTVYESDTNALPKNTPEPEPEPFTSNEVNTYGDLAFDEFWAFYPRKIGKGGAKKTWQKITRTTNADRIIDGARRMSQDPNLPETQFIPHPSTWLNEGRWEDEPYAPRTQANAKQVQQNTARAEFLNSFNQQQELTQNPDWA